MKKDSKKTGLRHEVIQLTPAKAQQILDKQANPLNRGQSAAAVQSYASDMRAGRWVLIPHGLVFGPDSKLLDGHHRCAAVVESGATVPMVASYYDNATDATAALHAIDRGKARRTGHILELLGHIEPGKGTRVDAIVRALAVLTGDAGARLTADDVLLRYVQNKGAVDWAIAFSSRAYASPVLAAMAYAWRAYPKQVEEFQQLVTEKTGLVAGSAAHRFVMTMDRIRDMRASSRAASVGAGAGDGSKRAAMLITLRAIAGHIRGETMHRLYPTEEGKAFVDAALAKQARRAA